GFGEAIDVTVEGLPNGITASPLQILSNGKTATLLFTAGENAAEWTGPIKVVGRARLPIPDKLPALQKADAAVASAATLDAQAKAMASLAASALEKSKQVLAELKQASSSAPNDEATKKAIAAAQTSLDAITPVAKNAADGAKNADKALADA